MAIGLDELATAAGRRPLIKVARSMSEARSMGDQTAFLSYNHLDKKYAEGLQVLLKEHGWKIYVDWEDMSMPEIPNQETANLVKRRISEHDWFLFLATPNSASSKWCPWEIGFADKARGVDRIFVVSTTDGYTSYGREYLQLYRQITAATGGELAAFFPDPNPRGVFIKSLVKT